MFRLFGFRESGKRVEEASFRARPAQPAAYAEALLAGWVPPQPEIGDQTSCAERAIEDTFDSAAFLARVYLHQHC